MHVWSRIFIDKYIFNTVEQEISILNMFWLKICFSKRYFLEKISRSKYTIWIVIYILYILDLSFCLYSISYFHFHSLVSGFSYTVSYLFSQNSCWCKNILFWVSWPRTSDISNLLYLVVGSSNTCRHPWFTIQLSFSNVVICHDCNSC